MCNMGTTLRTEQSVLPNPCAASQLNTCLATADVRKQVVDVMNYSLLFSMRRDHLLADLKPTPGLLPGNAPQTGCPYKIKRGLSLILTLLDLHIICS